MKKQILFSFFLFSAIFVINVFPQNQSSELITESIKLENTSSGDEEEQNCGFDKKTMFVIKVIKPLLSEKSQLEVNLRTKVVTITDSRNRVKFIIEFLKKLNDEDLTNWRNITLETVKIPFVFP